jgi:phosphate butyryltransferase
VLVKGGCDSARLLRGVLEGLPKEERPFLSHVAMIENPFGGRLLALSDGGLNVDPDCEKKIRILENGARLLRALGHARPRVLLAAGMEDKGQAAPAVADAREILRRHRAGEWPHLLIDGPYGLDVAFSAEAALAKGIKSPLSGRADLVLCPDLESCNFAVKMAALYGQGRWAGVVVGGACAVVIGSRADDAPSRLASLALASIAAGVDRG